MLDMTYAEFLELVDGCKEAIEDLDSEKEWDEDRDEYCIGDQLLDDAKEEKLDDYSPRNQVSLATAAAILDASPYANYHQIVGYSFPANEMSAEEIIRSLLQDCFEGHVKES